MPKTITDELVLEMKVTIADYIWFMDKMIEMVAKLGVSSYTAELLFDLRKGKLRTLMTKLDNLND